jgi:D-lactate dehydrogenase (cytochrome)
MAIKDVKAGLRNEEGISTVLGILKQFGGEGVKEG